MPFTFKLSQRLARMRSAALLLSTATLAACEQPVGSPVAPPLPPPPSPVVKVVVSPDTVTLAASQTKQFAAYGRTAAGDSVPVTVTWSASAGSVTQSGFFTAAPDTGHSQVAATQTGGSPSGNATVTVVAPLPPSPAGAYPNEPAGFLPITERSFLATVENGWTATTAGGLSIVSDATAPKSPSAVGQMIYPAGASDLDPGWTEYASLAGLGYTRLYMSFWVKLSANWQGHKTSVNKIGYVWVHDKPVVFPLVQGVGSAPLHTAVGLQDIPNLVAVTEAPNLGTVEIVRGQWHRWELVLVMNSGSNADGELHWWIDGVKVGEYKNIEYGDATQGKVWQDPSWRPIWGGQGDTLVQTQYMWMDHYYASGAP